MSEVFDFVTIHRDILKSASPKAARIIRENPLWFSSLYFVAVNDRDSEDDEIINQFWRNTPLFVMQERPNWFVPYEVLYELVTLSRRDYDLYKHPR